MRKVSLLMLLALCLFTSNALASDRVTVSRSWENPTNNLEATLAVQVQETWYDAQGHPHTSMSTKWVYVHIRLVDPAPLRKGEIEYFAVSGYSGGGSSSISVHINPELTYHAYNSGWTSVFGHGGNAYVNIGHNGRMKNSPPISINEAKATFTTPEEPFELTFNDFAIGDNNEAQTTYLFEIKRSVVLFPNKLIAKGVVKGNDSGKIKVTITKDSPFCNDGAEYFKNGKKYRVALRLKREGSSYYTDKYSPEGSFKFKWETGKGIVNLEKVENNEKEEKKTQRFNKMYK